MARVTIIEIAAVIVFILAALGNPVAAEDTMPELPAAMKNDQLFKTLCIGEKSTGFNWRNNEWNSTRFKPEKYFIEKLKPERSARTLLCWSDAQEKKRHESNDMALDWGCYNVHEGMNRAALAVNFEEITREPLKAPTSFGSSRFCARPSDASRSFVFVWSYHQFR